MLPSSGIYVKLSPCVLQSLGFAEFEACFLFGLKETGRKVKLDGREVERSQGIGKNV